MHNKQEKTSLQSAGTGILGDPHELSHLILECANRGEPREDFLGEVCRLILDRAGCDMLNIVYRENERWYLCNSSRGPGDKPSGVTIALMGREICGGGLPGRIEALAQLRNKILCNKTFPGSSFTPHGSFWTGNAAKPLKMHSGTGDGEAQIQINIGGEFLCFFGKSVFRQIATEQQHICVT